MNTMLKEVQALLASAFADRTPEWVQYHVVNNLPRTIEGARWWSTKMGRPTSFFGSGGSTYWDGNGNSAFYCPNWLIIERSRKARSIRRELQRIHGLEFRAFFKIEAKANRRVDLNELDPMDTLVALIRNCVLSPNETISRSVKIVPDGITTGTKHLVREYKPFAHNNCVGIEFEAYGTIRRKRLTELLPHYTRVVSDGSIRTEVRGTEAHEVRVLLDRTKAEPRLYKLCARLQELGLRVNRSCGLHIHLDTRAAGSFDEVVKVGRIVDAWLYALRELLPQSRRQNDFCKFGIAINDRYRAVNVSSWHKHKTLEIRVHSATLDYTKVVAWLRLCELIRAMPKKPKAASCIATLEQLPLANHDLAYWRARHRELNTVMYASNTTDVSSDSE